MKSAFKELLEVIRDHAGTQKGEAAKMLYDVKRFEQERRRNILMFYFTILLGIITICNIYIAFLNYEIKVAEFSSETHSLRHLPINDTIK